MTVKASLSLVAAQWAREAGVGRAQVSPASGCEGDASGAGCRAEEECLAVGATGREGGWRKWARAWRSR